MTQTGNPDSSAWRSNAHMLTEALPFMQLHDKQSISLKFGGQEMGDAQLSADFAHDVVLLKQSGINPVIVHGGGPQIANMLNRLGIPSRFKDGLRVTDAKTLEVVEMVLAGIINKQIVTALNRVGGLAVGLSGKDGNLMMATKTTRKTYDTDSNLEKILDLGFVGTPDKVNPAVLKIMLESDIIPVIAPIAFDANGQTLNVNADIAAGAIAAALNAKRLLLLTDVAGVLDKNGALIPHIEAVRAKRLIRNGTVQGGMIPKVETALAAVQNGVDAVAILDGRVPHAILLELFTALGAGTLIE